MILELIYDPNLEVNGFSKYKGVGFIPDVFVFLNMICVMAILSPSHNSE